MATGNIASEWESYTATVRHKKYKLLSHIAEASGLTATIVTNSWDVSHAGYNCPDGHIFSDKSTVEATPGQPTTREDMEEMREDDKEMAKELYGTEAKEDVWHEGIRSDIDGAPDDKTYDSRKVYVNPRWDLEFQLEEIRKGRTKKRIKPAR